MEQQMDIHTQKLTDIERFDQRRWKNPETDCWEWVGSTSQNGYGLFWFRNKIAQVHRVSYILFVGEIPEGLVIDHLCRNIECVNPEHLEPVTRKENALRGVGWAGANSRKMVCPQGHSYSGDNLLITIRGRRCRTCHNSEATRSYHFRKVKK
jgi:hypothetical protein